MVPYFHFQCFRVHGLLEIESAITRDSEVKINDVVVYCPKHRWVSCGWLYFRCESLIRPYSVAVRKLFTRKFV